ncbi:MAG: carbamoyltransferase [Gammaproteobacteria bacterium]|nr:carbamoyltransferase [Gammaproteobacteria bacterium]
MKRILGISAYYHDSAVALLEDGVLTAAVQEERFSRKKHDARFPTAAMRYCLDTAGVPLDRFDSVVFYDKPLLKFDRLLETYLACAPRGFRSFLTAMPVWLKEKLYLKTLLRQELAKVSEIPIQALPPLLFTEHHQSHAASAFFASPFPKAAVLCLDGVGEWATTSVWQGDGCRLEPLWQMDFPHSLGLLYSAFTFYTGFKVNSGEYKVMGLAPYGQPRYVDRILETLVDLKPDGTFRLNMDYFDYTTGLNMTNARFHTLFEGPPRQPETQLTQRDMDLARSIQEATEEIVLRLARAVRQETGNEYLCLAGGVALNCVANGRILREGIFRDLWIQPAAGDAGGAVGAALAAWHQYANQPREADGRTDQMHGAFLGPCFDNKEVGARLARLGAKSLVLPDEELLPQIARLLAEEKVVGWFQGAMEFGPRALGARSILGDPRSPAMQKVMNLKIKYRESFRPFAPSVLMEKVTENFDLDQASPYMLLVAKVRPERCMPMNPAQQALFGLDLLNIPRSDLPAITHIDYSARVQTVHADTNPRYHALLRAFEALTGCAVLVNTSFNVRGEPIVCTPEDAYRCFMRTEMDYLVVQNHLLTKAEQPAITDDHAWMQEFALD